MLVKDKFHRLIDEIDDEDTLKSYFTLISNLNSGESGEIYKKLTDLQKEELNLAYLESLDETELIDHRDVHF